MAECKWYVLRAVSGQERKVEQYLRTEVARQKLELVIPSVLVPSERVFEMRNGKKVSREKTNFPGYILVEADLSHGEALHTITSIPNVIGFLGNTEKGMAAKIPVPLRPSEVNRILGVVDNNEHAEEKLETPYMKGETIKIVDGPFNGFTGIVEEVLEERKKLNVTVKIFGRSTPVELSYVQVEKDV